MVFDGLTVLIGAFFFYCLAHPQRVRNRTQYWAVFVCLLLITLMHTLRLMLADNSAGFQVFSGVVIGVLHAAGLVLTVLYVGGLRVTDLAGELRDAADDFRRGGEPAKPVIVPLTGEQPKPRDPAAPAVAIPRPAPPEPATPPRVVIDLPKPPPAGDDRLPLA